MPNRHDAVRWPEGIETGKNALNIATELAKGVFPESGRIVTNDGQIQTKWGNYQLPNPQDADIVEKLLDATRYLLNKIPAAAWKRMRFLPIMTDFVQ